MLSMCLACWTVRVAAVHAHLRVVGMHSGFCCLAAWCIGSVLPYPLFNSCKKRRNEGKNIIKE